MLSLKLFSARLEHENYFSQIVFHYDTPGDNLILSQPISYLM